MPDNVAYLIGTTTKPDDIGQQIETPTRKKVFCNEISITRAEFYDAGRSGLKPERAISLFFDDYAGEQAVEIDGHKYSVYRTYKKGDNQEIYLHKKVGT